MKSLSNKIRYIRKEDREELSALESMDLNFNDYYYERERILKRNTTDVTADEIAITLDLIAKDFE